MDGRLYCRRAAMWEASASMGGSGVDVLQRGRQWCRRGASLDWLGANNNGIIGIGDDDRYCIMMLQLQTESKGRGCPWMNGGEDL